MVKNDLPVDKTNGTIAANIIMKLQNEKRNVFW